MAESRSLKEFYAGKNILVTGGSGFLGICLLEKILRAIPEHGEIYLLLRPKRGKTIDERLDDIKKNQIFDFLLKEESEEKVFAKLRVVAGDVGEENLGLSPEDRALLTEKINVIIHSAATLDFAETLRSAVNINYLGTQRVADLAKQCQNLSALVHVSSAYVNSYKLEVEEFIYPLLKDPEEVVKLVETYNDEELEKQNEEILGPHPNCYTFTKHMAEHEIQKIEKLLPCAIVRPSMIIGALKEPVPGWTISKNGPQGFMMGAAKGVIRRLPVRKELVYDYIPVDIVVNNLLAAGFYVGSNKPNLVQVYHCTSSTRNPFCWAIVEDEINDMLRQNPLKSAVWYPHLKFIPYIWLYKIAAIFAHIIPAIFLDAVTKLAGGRPILLKLHRNVNASLGRLEKFIFTEWKFYSPKTEELQRWMSKSDQADFSLDINNIVWLDYFKHLALGSRIFLNKEPLSNLEAARRKHNLLMVLHYSLKALQYLGASYLASLVLGLNWQQAIFVIPAAFIVESFI